MTEAKKLLLDERAKHVERLNAATDEKERSSIESDIAVVEAELKKLNREEDTAEPADMTNAKGNGGFDQIEDVEEVTNTGDDDEE